ncbi:hypothetical protein CALVIDRAFT_367336 [Calocera viscosa TUFC12733]|uniref:Uncharacterized protein n=1 Tax=Calocera viscosa (strain TUFC12733) TaxID=1330018 RepID=A0A167H1S7_CALVF|nr:hypothetical protein CALVIDRAFT_367336 [Calocera viscosa TUFC12733]
MSLWPMRVTLGAGRRVPVLAPKRSQTDPILAYKTRPARFAILALTSTLCALVECTSLWDTSRTHAVLGARWIRLIGLLNRFAAALYGEQSFMSWQHGSFSQLQVFVSIVPQTLAFLGLHGGRQSIVL